MPTCRIWVQCCWTFWFFKRIQTWVLLNPPDFIGVINLKKKKAKKGIVIKQNMPTQEPSSRALGGFRLEVSLQILFTRTGRPGRPPGMPVPQFPHLSNESIRPDGPILLSQVSFWILLFTWQFFHPKTHHFQLQLEASNQKGILAEFPFLSRANYKRLGGKQAPRSLSHLVTFIPLYY